MKVCILTHNYPPAQGAAELYIGNLTNELAKLGIEVIVITLAHDPTLKSFEKKG